MNLPSTSELLDNLLGKSMHTECKCIDKLERYIADIESVEDIEQEGASRMILGYIKALEDVKNELKDIVNDIKSGDNEEEGTNISPEDMEEVLGIIEAPSIGHNVLDNYRKGFYAGWSECRRKIRKAVMDLSR